MELFNILASGKPKNEEEYNKLAITPREMKALVNNVLEGLDFLYDQSPKFKLSAVAEIFAISPNGDSRVSYSVPLDGDVMLGLIREHNLSSSFSEQTKKGFYDKLRPVDFLVNAGAVSRKAGLDVLAVLILSEMFFKKVTKEEMETGAFALPSEDIKNRQEAVMAVMLNLKGEGISAKRDLVRKNGKVELKKIEIATTDKGEIQANILKEFYKSYLGI